MSNQAPKLRDHVGMLQDAFAELLTTMFQSINWINANATLPQDNPNPNDPKQASFDQIPLQAQQVINRVKEIDALIDEANSQTCIGKEIDDIKAAIQEQSDEYDRQVGELSSKCEEAEKWLQRIHQMLDVIAKNTPWIRSQ